MSGLNPSHNASIRPEEGGDVASYRLSAVSPFHQRRMVDLKTLYEVGSVLSSTLELPELLQKIMSLSKATVGSETASIALKDDETGELILECVTGLPEEVKPGMRIQHGGSIAEWVCRNGKPVLMNGNPALDKRFINLKSRDHIRSALCVPLIGKRETIGVLSLNNRTRYQIFTHDDQNLLVSIATQAGIAIENARLHQKMIAANRQLKSTVDRLDSLKSCLTHMTSSSLLDSLQILLDAAIEGTPSVSGNLTVLDEREKIHRLKRGEAGDAPQPAVDEGIPGDSLMNPFISLPRFAGKPGCWIMQVMSAEGKPIGLLKLAADPDGPGFSQEDREFVSALVEHASIVVFNNMLFQKAEAGRIALEKAYKELQEKQSQLLISEKMAVIGRLAAKVGHEINNPLTAILGCAQMLLKNAAEDGASSSYDANVVEYIKIIYAEAERCKRITGDLLQTARQQELVMMEANLPQILNHVIQLVKFENHEDIEFDVHYESDFPVIFANPEQLTQVFLNLVTNAVEAMPEGGVIEVRARRTQDADTGDTYALAEIRDAGTGIDEGIARKCFEPFYTTKAKGTGLGLTICKAIVENHGGDLRLTALPQKGSVATVRLPLRNLESSGNPFAETRTF